MAKLTTQAPGKGDLVKGHCVAMFWPGLPYIRGKVVSVSKSGHAVEVEIDRVLSAFGLPRRSRWTWRRSVNAYQHQHERTKRGAGLALLKGAC